jgi:presenilin-like A22 family membrane protease
MKHNIKITAILLGMFLIAQFIGLFVTSQYIPEKQKIYDNKTGNLSENYLEINKIPYGMHPEENEKPGFFNIVISFIIAISLILIIMKYKMKWVIKSFFFIIITLALAISFNAILKNYIYNSTIISMAIALFLSSFKIFRPHFILHNLTELFIYPGIAPIFVMIFNPATIIIMLILISVYDIWAVWHSGIMQKMAKFQIEEAGIFGGFFIPYLTKELKAKIALLKKSKSNKKHKIKVSLAMLGGGDVIFPIITAGVFLKYFGFSSAFAVILGAFAGLLFLLFVSQKKKFYPAMPFITAGIFFGLMVWARFNFVI